MNARIHIQPGTPLSRREQDILELIAEGSSDPEIGEILGITPDTVRTFNKRIFARLEARNRTHAVAVAYDQGLLPRRQRAGEAA